MSDHPEYIDELDELVDTFDHAEARKGLEAALLKGQELERAKWQKTTECDTPEKIEKAIAIRYKWLLAWQEWARELLEEKGRQLEDGWHGDSQTREILGSLIGEARGAPTDDDDMCPNCVTPWKCNGPHEMVDEHYEVVITVNGQGYKVPFAIYLDYDAVVTLAYGEARPYLTVVYRSSRGNGSLYRGSPVVKPCDGMIFSVVNTGNA